MHKDKNILEGILQDENVTYSIIEISELCAISEEMIVQMIEYDIITPSQDNQQMFNYIALHRAQKAMRLHQDLEINWAGIAVILDLLNEINELKKRVAL